MEVLFMTLVILFALSCVAFSVSLFYVKKSLVPMWICVAVINVLNILILFTSYGN